MAVAAYEQQTSRSGNFMVRWFQRMRILTVEVDDEDYDIKYEMISMFT